jgi:hypothetical protein
MNKTVMLFTAILIITLAGISCTQAQDLEPSPHVYTDKFKTAIKAGDVIDSSKHDLGVVVKFSKAMKGYDLLEIVLYRTYNGQPDEIAEKGFLPASKEFSIKYDKLDSVKIYFIDPSKPDTKYVPDIYTGNYSPSYIFLKDGDRGKSNDYYFVVKGFIKTGSHAVYAQDGTTAKMVDDYDHGTLLTEESVHFKAFEKAADQAPQKTQGQSQKKSLVKSLFGK